MQDNESFVSQYFFTFFGSITILGKARKFHEANSFTKVILICNFGLGCPIITSKLSDLELLTINRNEVHGILCPKHIYFQKLGS